MREFTLAKEGGRYTETEFRKKAALFKQLTRAVDIELRDMQGYVDVVVVVVGGGGDYAVVVVAAVVVVMVVVVAAVVVCCVLSFWLLLFIPHNNSAVLLARSVDVQG
jgi:hypothetical protein